ncbi:hypothetical protein FIU93_03645 [Labrenzia sp. THAF35]|uniref:hypothetical protein n=1 Tax=Labrenzia sp. THAF35 TaxID=2587854 RepID=UPI001267F9DC|nr:hypothetical protein [Labrenzia sp. THAF35]QFT65859.1 hypothetical protein FIU93_03645 [Labrenzia sp. THAF35]
MNTVRIIVGGIITLVITIAGTFAAVYASKILLESAPEDINYRVLEESSISVDDTSFAIANISVLNTGGEVSKDVVFTLRYGDGAKIERHSISAQDYLVSEISTEVNTNSITVTAKQLRPDDKFYLSLVASGTTVENPKISLVSSNSIGHEYSSETNFRNIEYENLFPIISSIFAIIFASLSLLALRKTPFFRRVTPASPNRTSTAFILTMIDEVQLASDLLKAEIAQRGAEPTALLNWGLIEGLQGNERLSKKLLNSGLWWKNNNHLKALYFFNKSLVELSKNNISESANLLKSAFSYKKHEISWYCTISSQIEIGAEKHEQIKKVTEQNGVVFEKTLPIE